MPAQFKEIVMASYLLQTQQGLPNGGQDLFSFSLRRFIVTADDSALIWRRQCLAIQLAIGRERERIQHDKCPRQHMFHQAGTQLLTQVGWIECHARLWDQVSHQPLITGFFCAGDDDGITDAFTRR
ncbi:hypothetical protein Xkoz_00001 [Xenorhabdus kozodoii]|uniref:Uncharacterized protein n=1 Tax=Xenorhabdus kozodoii TaxID=351676 RepID=A0A2D0LH99_9GAMM|nr:hypothetical protein Xkoz_00001 [Xenorhabdus kozodoii]